jgi:hypothetical protein
MEAAVLPVRQACTRLERAWQLKLNAFPVELENIRLAVA